MNLDTYEIQLDTVGAEAVQQTLDALGVQAPAVRGEMEREEGGKGERENPDGLLSPRTQFLGAPPFSPASPAGDLTGDSTRAPGPVVPESGEGTEPVAPGPVAPDQSFRRQSSRNRSHRNQSRRQPVAQESQDGTADNTSPADLSPLLAALDRQTEILVRIAAAIERQPQPAQPTY